MAPIVSVIIPCFNHEQFVGEAIESVLSQTFDDWELIIVDDASTDDSWKVITGFADSRIHAFRQTSNVGNSRNYNEALARSSGDVIMPLGSDDTFLPNKMARQVAYLQDHPEIGVLGGYVLTSPAEASAGQWFSTGVDLNDPRSWIWQNRLAHCSTAITREAHVLMGPADPDLTRVLDWDLWLKAWAAGVRFEVIREPLAVYRVQATSMTHGDPAGAVLEYMNVCRAHWNSALRLAGRTDLVRENILGAIDRYGAATAEGRERLKDPLVEFLDSTPESTEAILAAAVDRERIYRAWVEASDYGAATRSAMAEVQTAKEWYESRWEGAIEQVEQARSSLSEIQDAKSDVEKAKQWYESRWEGAVEQLAQVRSALDDANKATHEVETAKVWYASRWHDAVDQLQQGRRDLSEAKAAIRQREEALTAELAQLREDLAISQAMLDALPKRQHDRVLRKIKGTRSK